MLISGGKIAQVAERIEPTDDMTIIEADGLLVLPGAIDVHTHFDLEVMGIRVGDNFYSGSRAAAAGGTTTFIDFVHPKRGEDYLEAINNTRIAADQQVVIDYGLHLATTWYDEVSCRQKLQQAVDQGISSIKVYLAYRETVGVSDEELFAVLEAARDMQALVIAHAEDDNLVRLCTQRALRDGYTGPIGHKMARPTEAEALGTAKVVSYAAVVGVPIYLVHVSCSRSYSIIHGARGRSQLVAAETCPQYLLLHDIVYEKLGWEAAKWVLTPPLRSATDNELLFMALNHRQIQTIATDHCPFNFEGDKDRHSGEDFTRIPGGIPGVQDRLELMYSHGVLKRRIDEQLWVEVCCTNPARLFGMYPQKGTIEVGSDADIVLFDPRTEWTLTSDERLHHVDYSAYEGFKMKGKVDKVFSRGELVHESSWTTEDAGRGRFVARTPSSLFSEGSPG